MEDKNPKKENKPTAMNTKKLQIRKVKDQKEYDPNYNSNYKTNDDSFSNNPNNISGEKIESQKVEILAPPPGSKGKKTRIIKIKKQGGNGQQSIEDIKSELFKGGAKNVKVVQLNIKPLKRIFEKLEKKCNIKYRYFNTWKSISSVSTSKESLSRKGTVKVKKKKLKLNLKKRDNSQTPERGGMSDRSDRSEKSGTGTSEESEKDTKLTELTDPNKDKIKNDDNESISHGQKKELEVIEEKPNQEDFDDVYKNIVNVMKKGDKIQRRESKQILLDMLDSLDQNKDNKKSDIVTDNNYYITNFKIKGRAYKILKEAFEKNSVKKKIFFNLESFNR
jgi:hypothetical protein